MDFISSHLVLWIISTILVYAILYFVGRVTGPNNSRIGNYLCNFALIIFGGVILLFVLSLIINITNCLW